MSLKKKDKKQKLKRKEKRKKYNEGKSSWKNKARKD